MGEVIGGIYHCRNPKVSPFYQCVQNHFEEFEKIYSERFEEKCGYLRMVVKDVIYQFLDCGILDLGFARIRCGDCGQEYLLAFSCKCHYFCPFCHQKRVVSFGEWLAREVLFNVSHRQYVFAIPKMLRIYFRYDRKLLGKLSRCAYDSMKEPIAHLPMKLTHNPP